MNLSEKDLRRISKELVDRERELLYSEEMSNVERIAILERFIVEQEKKLGHDDSKKTDR